MSVAFNKGQVTGPDDLKIEIRNSLGVLVDPYAITYSIFDYTTGVEVLIGPPNQQPLSTSTGQFYASFTIPLDANIGDWVVRWNFKELATSPIIQAVQRFNVLGDTSVTSVTTSTFMGTMIYRLRIMLRDNNPDRNYRFRPPSTEKFLQTQTEVFGYIWEDEELEEYILWSIDEFNAAPPVTDNTINDLPTRWRTVILMGAAAHACRAIAMNWIADEFSVSGEEKVRIKLEGGEEIDVSIEELYDVLYAEQDKAFLEATIKQFEEEDKAE